MSDRSNEQYLEEVNQRAQEAFKDDDVEAVEKIIDDLKYQGFVGPAKVLSDQLLEYLADDAKELDE